MTISKAVGAIASALAIMVVSYLALDYGVMNETGFILVITALAGLGGWTSYQVSKK